jgi:hypothetical protein
MPDGVNVRFDDNMPKEQIQSMIASKYPDFAKSMGYNPTTEEQTPEKDYTLGRIATIDSGATFGFGRKIGGLLNAIGSYPVDRAAEALGVENTPSFMDRYNEIVEPVVKAKEEYAQDRPAEAIGLELGSSFVNPVNKLGVGYIGKGANTLSKGIRSVGVGAGTGGISAVGNTENTDDLVKNIGSGTAVGSAIGAAIPLAGATVRGIGKAVPEFLGLTTGAGNSSIKQALDAGKRGSESFLQSMRKGSEVTKDIIDLAENDFKQLGRQNYQTYKNAMENIGNVENIDFNPIKNTFNKIIKEESGGKPYLIDDYTKKVISKTYKMLKTFSKDNRKTLKDYDDLKQAIGKISVPLEAGNAKKVQGELYNAVKGEISKQAPIYSDIMKESEEGLEKLGELKKTFSLGKKSSGDTVLRKLQSANRNNVLTNYGRREELLKQLPHGEELADRIAGQTLNSLTPRGLEARAAGLFGSGASFAGMFNPAYLLSASPRIVGETAYKMGQISNYLPNSTSITPYLAQILGKKEK